MTDAKKPKVLLVKDVKIYSENLTKDSSFKFSDPNDYWSIPAGTLLEYYDNVVQEGVSYPVVFHNDEALSVGLKFVFDWNLIQVLP